jgi:diguanylate cyclase (GGDEF)-like protein
VSARFGIILVLLLAAAGIALFYFEPDFINRSTSLRSFFEPAFFFCLGAILSLIFNKLRKPRAEGAGTLEEQEKQRSLHDSLTQAYNKRHMDKVLGQFWEMAQQSGTPFSLLLLDIDNFRTINARFGHEVGDRVLQSVVHNIQSNTRKTDMVFRFGADRFLLLLPMTRGEFALTMANRLREEYSKVTFRGPARENFKADFSVGVMDYRGELTGLDEMLRRVEGALLRAKKENGRISLAS